MQAISLWIKIPCTLFVAVLIPVYWIRYGAENFLWFSDMALFGTVAGLWLGSSLLVSMMAVGVLLFDLVWSVAFFLSLIRGAAAEGLVGYMFDPRISLSIRALSLFHLALPALQLWTLGKLGYAHRAWKYQAVLGWTLLMVTYAVSDPQENINWVFGVADISQKWLPPLLYLVALMVIYPVVVCYPTHRLLKKFFAPTRRPLNRFPGVDMWRGQ